MKTKTTILLIAGLSVAPLITNATNFLDKQNIIEKSKNSAIHKMAPKVAADCEPYPGCILWPQVRNPVMQDTKSEQQKEQQLGDKNNS